MSLVCKICGAQSGFESKRKLFDDRYGYPGIFDVKMCTSCKHEFLDAEFNESQLSELYSNYYPRSKIDVKTHRPHVEVNGLRSWINGNGYSTFRWVPINVRVLDIGCGSGESLGYYESRGCDAHGVEADNNIQRIADEYGYNVRVGLFNASFYDKNYFDYVTMSQVVEHLISPVDTLNSISTILKPGGYLILSTPNAKGWGARLFGNRWINWHAPYHLHFFSNSSIQQLANKSGFAVEQVKTITPSVWLHHQWCHLITCPNMACKSQYWLEENHYGVTQRTFLVLANIVHSLKINHLISRFFDALRLGDNKLYILRKL